MGDFNSGWNEPLCHAMRRRVGRAIGRWSMIQDGDRIVVGLSGGKDSLVLLHALSELRARSPVKFNLAACTVALTGMDVSSLENYCAVRGVSFFVVTQPIMEIIRERDERSPCSFCANMRRGVLSSWAAENKFTKLALGHNLDDAVETFFLNLLHAGRARSFTPVAHMTRTGITVIRPLIGATESATRDEAVRLNLPVLETVCPFAGHTERAHVKEWLETLRSEVPDLNSKVINALENLGGFDGSDRWLATSNEYSN